jgi:putative spermidine/putrescine transport system permease protein
MDARVLSMGRTTRPGVGAVAWHALWRGLIPVAGLILLAVFILGPLISMAMWAFAGAWYYPHLIPQEWSFKWWTWVFTHTNVGDAIKLSLEAATLATIASAVLCVPAAYAFARFRFRGKQPLMLSFLAANAFPKFGLYISIATLFYQLNVIDTLQGIVLIQMIETVLFMIWIPATAFQNIPRSLEEAARDAGASAVRTFVRITLPLAAPAIGVAMLLGFVSALDESQGTLIVGLPDYRTVPLLMYDVINSYPLSVGGVFSLFLSLPSVIVLIVAIRVLTRSQLVPGAVT